MRDDLVPGNPFPDLQLPDTTGRETALSKIARAQPLVLAFVRGWWCPRSRCAYASSSTSRTSSAGVRPARRCDRRRALRQRCPQGGLGGAFPFLSDVDRKVAEELDLLELTDETHRPSSPSRSCLIPGSSSGGSGAASGTGAIRPRMSCASSCARSSRWSSRATTPRLFGRQEAPRLPTRGSTRPSCGSGELGWKRALARRARGPSPRGRRRAGPSMVDGRPWIVRRIEEVGGRTAIHVSKDGLTGNPRLVGHHITAGPRVP